jgi:hypothetical protein
VKNRPPGDFLEEYWQMSERLEWAHAAFERGQDLAQPKLTFEQFEEYYQKWRSHIKEREVCAGLDQAREVMQRLRRELERTALRQLQKLIEARKDWCVSELMFQGVVATIGLRKSMPEHLKAEFEQVLRDPKTGESFDSEREFREAEQRANQAQAKFRKALVEFEIDWPERVDAALHERLEELGGEKANAWHAELAAQIANLGEAQPEKA